MRPDDFFDDGIDDPFLRGARKPRFRRELMREIRTGPLTDASDIEVAVPLARLIHDDLEAFGTDGNAEMADEDMREALLALNVSDAAKTASDRTALEVLAG